jgi:hypothetical protein
MGITLALVLLLWSAAAVVVDSFFAEPYREVAEQLEMRRAAVPDSTYFEHVERSLAGDWILSLCSRDIVRSAVTVKLASLEAAYRRKAPTELGPALESARTTLTRALECMPNDGNFWLRLAIVNFAAKSKVAVVEEQLKRSLASAPSESWIAKPRLAFAAQIREAAHPGIEQMVRIDAKNLVAYARDTELADFYVNANTGAQKALDEQIPATNELRSAALARAIAYAAESKPFRSNGD